MLLVVFGEPVLLQKTSHMPACTCNGIRGITPIYGTEEVAWGVRWKLRHRGAQTGLDTNPSRDWGWGSPHGTIPKRDQEGLRGSRKALRTKAFTQGSGSHLAPTCAPMAHAASTCLQ